MMKLRENEAVGAGAADILGGLVPERVATPEKCRDEAFRLFEEIETGQGKELAAAVAKDIFKRFGDPAGPRRKESKQSFGRFRKILLRNTIELLQIQFGEDLGATTAAKKISKMYPKEFPSVEAVEKMLKKFGLGARRAAGRNEVAYDLGAGPHRPQQFGGTGSSRARQRLIFRCRDHGGLGD
jgi:hypothetical protein